MASFNRVITLLLLPELDPLNCCSVDWLVGSELMPFVVGGTCADGTPIDQLDPDGFKGCPASYRSFGRRESKH